MRLRRRLSLKALKSPKPKSDEPFDLESIRLTREMIAASPAHPLKQPKRSSERGKPNLSCTCPCGLRSGRAGAQGGEGVSGLGVHPAAVADLAARTRRRDECRVGGVGRWEANEVSRARQTSGGGLDPDGKTAPAQSPGYASGCTLNANGYVHSRHIRMYA